MNGLTSSPVRPSGWWYAVAATIAGLTVVVTAALGYAEVTRLIDRINDFQRFGTPGATSVSIDEPGSYTVYDESRLLCYEGSDCMARTNQVTLTVTTADGRPVSTRLSDVDYGWGDRKGRAMVSFVVLEPGMYIIDTPDEYGTLAFGRSIPGGLFRGFEDTLAAGGAVVVACAAGAVMVGARRRRDMRSRLGA